MNNTSHNFLAGNEKGTKIKILKFRIFGKIHYLPLLLFVISAVILLKQQLKRKGSNVKQ